MNAIVVGGTFDIYGGKFSTIIHKLASYLVKYSGWNIHVLNGGYYTDLERIFSQLHTYQIIIWIPNVPNDLPKIRDVKANYPHAYLVSSKRNQGEYDFKYLVKHALELKSNLAIEFNKDNQGIVRGRVFDPLGAVWCDFTDNFEVLAQKLINRLNFLMWIHREKTVQKPGVISIPDVPEFFELVKNSAKVFHALVQPEKSVTRFLGNSSFRCARGFPSFRSGTVIFVSRRNVDKEYIDKDAFVPTYINANREICYLGPNKPSVDTPIQLRLYELFPNINYMIHSHVYVEDAPFTSQAIPCGGIEEVLEVTRLLQTDVQHAAINLIGHGNIVMSSDIEYFKTIKYISRNIPELMV